MHWNSSIMYKLKNYLMINRNSVYTYYKSVVVDSNSISHKKILGNESEIRCSLKE